MSTIDQLADDRDMLKSKLRQANAKLRQAKDQLGAIKTRRLELMHSLYRADAANVRARAMLCDAAGIPHDADILEWIAGAKARIARLEESLTSILEYWNRDNNDRAMEDACWHAIHTASEALDAEETKP